MEHQVQFGGDDRVFVELLEIRLVFRLGGVPAVLERRRDDHSFTSGFAMRDTWTKGPASTAGSPGSRSTFTLGRAVLAYMPITGLAVVPAGLPSLVMREIGTSIAIVLILAPLKRLTPNGLTVSTSSAAVRAGR